MKITEIKSVMALGRQDIIAMLTLIKSIRGMTPDIAQSFLLGIWIDWRRATGAMTKDEDNQADDVKDGIGHFFDLYFITRGDWEKMESIITSGMPEDMLKDVHQESDEMAALNIAQGARYGAPCEVKIQTMSIPGASHGPQEPN